MDIKDREYKYNRQLMGEELKQQVLLAERQKDQLALAEKEKSLQRLLFLQEQSKLENEARQQADASIATGSCPLRKSHHAKANEKPGPGAANTTET